MPSHTEIEASQAVAGKTVAAALQDNGLGAIPVHNALNHGLKDTLVRDIIDAVTKRKIDRVIFALSDADVAQLARPWEIFAVLVEGHRHDTIGGVKRLFDTVAVVDIDVDI